MRWMLRLTLALGCLVGLLAGIGWMLPVRHEATRSAEFSHPPSDVFALISDLDSYPEWWPDGVVKVAVVERVAPSRFVTRIVGETAFGGTWTIDIAPTPSGSRLTVTERGEIYNVIFRTLARFVFGHATTMESFLTAARLRLSAGGRGAGSGAF